MNRFRIWLAPVIMTLVAVAFLAGSVARAQAGAADSTKPATGATTATDSTKKPVPAASNATDAIKKDAAIGTAATDSTKKAAGAAADTTKKDAAAASKAAGAATTGDAAQKAGAAETKTPPAANRTPEKKPETPVDPAAPYKDVKFAAGEKPHVIMETSMGKIVIELWPDVAPKHCQSFVYLTDKHFYDSLTFHRVVPGFVIQGGDPSGNGTGGPGYNVPAEFSNTLHHEDGILSMARSSDPNSAGSQFFICLGKAPHLDGKYTIFGKVIEGMDAVRKIEAAPRAGERPTSKIYMTKVYMEPKAKTE